MNNFLVKNLGNTIKYTFIASVIYLITVVSVYIIAFHGEEISKSASAWGTFGDYIGGTLNPIFSLLALFSLLATIALQSNEMELTRAQLERAAVAQEKTEQVLNEQTKTQIKQQFESTFFSLLNQHNKALERISTPSGRWTDGRSDLDIVFGSIFYNTSVRELDSAKHQLENRNELCGHYFRILYQLLKFIAINHPDGQITNDFKVECLEKTPVSSDEKMYSNIVRSFIDYNTNQLLAINCYCKTDKDSYWKYKVLVERYAFLEHMPFTIKGKRNHLLEKTKEVYRSNAFGGSDFI